MKVQILNFLYKFNAKKRIYRKELGLHNLCQNHAALNTFKMGTILWV